MTIKTVTQKSKKSSKPIESATQAPRAPYKPTLDWEHVQERTLALGDLISDAEAELLRISEIISEAAIGTAGVDEIADAGREIRAACARGFTALLSALQVAGWYESIGWLGGSLCPPPPTRKDDQDGDT